MSCCKVNRLLTQRHVLPFRPLATFEKRHLIRICSLPVHMCVRLFLGKHSQARKDLCTYQLSCSNRRPAVSPAMINAGTTTITTPNAFSDGGRFL